MQSSHMHPMGASVAERRKSSSNRALAEQASVAGQPHDAAAPDTAERTSSPGSDAGGGPGGVGQTQAQEDTCRSGLRVECGERADEADEGGRQSVPAAPWLQAQTGSGFGGDRRRRPRRMCVVGMPGVHGPRTCRRMRRQTPRHPPQRTTPRR